MSQTIRVFWGEQASGPHNFNWPPITADSVVVITASEYDPAAQAGADGSARRFVGAASITVLNVSPHGAPSDPNNGVSFYLAVDWVRPLNICTDITVLDPAERVFYLEGAASPAH
jgi:hypothetical protein